MSQYGLSMPWHIFVYSRLRTTVTKIVADMFAHKCSTWHPLPNHLPNHLSRRLWAACALI